MGIRAGAEMTTFENRFVALRCKDTIAPTGTIAQGVHAKQINSRGEVYEDKYGLTTPQRIYGTVEEKRAGRGPCYLKTSGITEETQQDLYKAYLNMAPSQTLKWIESGKGPSEEDTEIDGTEPYVVGGHTASGFWVDTDRRTTLAGLYAAGDVAGGAPQKYVTGALAEGEIAAQSIIKDLDDEGNNSKGNNQEDADINNRGNDQDKITDDANNKASEYAAGSYIGGYLKHLNAPRSAVTIEQAEAAMQKIMDEYAGGISTDYRYNEAGLRIADERIRSLQELTDTLGASDMFELMHIYELKERLTVCRSLIAHLYARKETRWHIFGENADHPDMDDKYSCYVNSVYENGSIHIIYRPLIRTKSYVHSEASDFHIITQQRIQRTDS